MDLAELGIIFATEGADAAIAKMEEFREVTAEVVQTDEERVKSAGKVATATQSLSEQITRSILGYEKSQAAVYEYKSILLGANEALAEQIAHLKLLEQSEREMTRTAKELTAEQRAEEGVLLDLARDIQYLNKVREQEAAAAIAAAQKVAKEKERLAQEEARIIAQLNKDLQDSLDKRTKEEEAALEKRRKAKQKAAEDEAKIVAQLNRDLQTALDKQTKDAVKAAEDRAISEISWAKKSRDEQIRIKDEIAAYSKAGVSKETLGNMFGTGALNGTVKEVESLSKKWEDVTFNTSRARSEMVVLAHEAIQGRFSRIPASMMVFAEYTDVTALALSRAGIAFMALTAAAVGLGIAMVKGLLEQRELQNALIMTGNYAGTTEGQLNLLAHTATTMGGSIGTAKEVILQLAASGKFTGEQIDAIVPAIVRMEDATGGGKEAVAQLIGEFKSLAVEANAHSRYSDEVSKAVLKLDNQYHFLTSSVFAHIRALEAEGQTKEASILATNEFAKVTDERAKEIFSNLGAIEKGWRHIKEAIGEAWSAMKDWGKSETLQGKLESAAKKIEDLADPTIQVGHQTINLATDHRKGLQAEALKEYNLVVAEYLEQQKKVAKEAENSRTQNAANHAISEVTLSDQQMKADKLGLLATKQAEYDAQLKRMREGLAAAKPEEDTTALQGLLTDEAIAKHRAGLEKLYGEKAKVTKEYDTTALRDFISARNAEFTVQVKQTNEIIGDLDRKYTTAVKLENDRFSIVRTNAAAESALGFASANEYIQHYEAIATASRATLTEKLGALDKEQEAGDHRTVAILAELEKQVTATAKGEQVKLAAIRKATDDQIALHTELQDKRVKASNKAENDLQQAFSETMKLQNADIEKQIGMQEKKNKKIEEEIFALTHTKEEVERLRAANEQAYLEKLAQSIKLAELQRDQIVGLMESQTLSDKEYIDAMAKIVLLDAQISKSKTLLQLKDDYKKLLLDKADAQAEAERIKAVEGEWKKTWEATNNVAHAAFLDWAEKGEDAGKKIGETLKKALLEAIYSAAIKPIVFSIVASVIGGGSSKDAAEAEAKDVLGLGKLTSGGISYLKDALGITAFGGAASSGYALAAGGNAMATFSAGAEMVGSATGITSFTAGVGQMAGAAASGIGSAVSSALAAIPGWGWALMALATQFDQNKITATGTGLMAQVSGTGATGVQTTADYRQDHHGIFGIGAYTTNNREYTNAGSETTDALSKAVQEITKANGQFAAMLGLDAKALDNYSASLEINTTNLDAAGVEAAIAAELTKFSANQLTSAYGDAVKEFAKAGETVAQTLERLIDTQQARVVLNELGGIFSKISMTGIDATESMIALSGGLDNLIKKSADFVKNYYSADEQTGMAAKSILTTLATVGLDMNGIDTKAEFRTLLEGLNVSTQLGLQQVNALLNVQGAFSELTAVMGEQKLDLTGLAGLAPEIAALNPLFSASKDATTEGANSTTGAINATTSAVTEGSNNVVSAVTGLSATVASNGASTIAAINRLNDRLDAIETNGRLNMSDNFA
jgi:hypothetical protein